MSAALSETEAIERRELSFSLANFPEEPTFKRLGVEFADIGRRVWNQMELVTIQLLNCPTAEDFLDLRKRLYERYWKLSIAMSGILLAAMDENERAVLVQESLGAMEEKFRVAGAQYFGDEAVHETLFSLATLKRTYKWVPHLLSTASTLNADKAAQDKDLAAKFSSYVLWSQFHFDCLRVALDRKQMVKQEILTELLEGLRLSVMAYTCVRQALDLRGFSEKRYRDFPSVTWDEEDEALANLPTDETE